MGLLLAAALAAHIQTGQDLLAVCKTQQQTCGAFVHRALASDWQHTDLCLRGKTNAQISAAIVAHAIERPKDAKAGPRWLAARSVDYKLCSNAMDAS